MNGLALEDILGNDFVEVRSLSFLSFSITIILFCLHIHKRGNKLFQRSY